MVTLQKKNDIYPQLWVTLGDYDPNYLLEYLPQEVTDTANFGGETLYKTQ